MAADSPRWTTRSDLRPRVAIVGAPDRARVDAELARIEPMIADAADLEVVDLDFSFDFRQAELDLVIVLGGDGTILQTARQMGTNQLPVLAINCGTLGFLASLSPDDFLDTWPRICAGDFDTVSHLMLRCSLVREGSIVADSLGLNEAAVLGGPPYRVQNIDLFVDGHLATTYVADGLLISTPVGSTAYNLSAGGPILRKNLQAFVISPLNAHTLTYRPVVDSADCVFELTLADPSPSSSIVVDGRILGTIHSGDRIRIQRAESAFQMISVPGHNDYRTLRDKLGWGGNALRK